MKDRPPDQVRGRSFLVAQIVFHPTKIWLTY